MKCDSVEIAACTMAGARHCNTDHHKFNMYREIFLKNTILFTTLSTLHYLTVARFARAAQQSRYAMQHATFEQ